jgi:acylphosphatase
MKSYKFKIVGKVQGVFYRVSVQKAASKAHFSGYVKNMPDRSVEACVTCKEEMLEDFMQILREGSSKSQVDEIIVSPSEENFSDGFEILK